MQTEVKTAAATASGVADITGSSVHGAASLGKKEKILHRYHCVAANPL